MGLSKPPPYPYCDAPHCFRHGMYDGKCPEHRIAELKQELASYMESDANLRKKVEELEAERTALEDGLRPIATEMIEPECPEDEVDDCETCQCFIDWGNRILALLGKESEDE